MPTTLDKIAAFARQTHADNRDGHDFAHIARVVTLAEKILASEPTADSALVEACCYLHDSYDDKLFDNVQLQKARVKAFLKTLPLSADRIKQIFYIIDHISFSANLDSRQPLDINGQIVQDADRLDAMGATMIVRTLEYGWAHHRTLYDPAIAPQHYHDKADYHQNQGATTINHFYEKAFLLKDLLNTAKAREMGLSRDRAMHDFVEAFEQEWREAHHD